MDMDLRGIASIAPSLRLSDNGRLRRTRPPARTIPEASASGVRLPVSFMEDVSRQKL